MSDRREIETALYDVAAALDDRDWAALGAAFTADATGYGQTGREAIVANTRAHLGGCGPSQHLLGNVRIEVDGDTARSWSYARVYHVGVGAQEGSCFECLGQYTDRWQRVDGTWLLTFRGFDVRITVGDWAVLQPG